MAVYAEPYAPKRPTVCFDATRWQWLADTQAPRPVRPGRPARCDYEYKRAGPRHLCIAWAPQAGWRHVEVTERRTQHECAHQMPWLVDVRSPEADVIRVVLDNLNTHGPGSLYEACAPADARRLVEKLALPYTPQHGSWLHMAEIALSMLQRQCLQRRIADEGTLRREVAAWEHQRNTMKETIAWRFSITDARAKLTRLYPTNSVR